MDNLLVGATVKALCSVHDYWQLITDQPIVTINNPFQVIYNDEIVTCDRYSIVQGQKIMDEKYVENGYYEITLTSNISIKISLSPEDYTCPEGVYIYNSNEGLFIVF